MGCLVKLKQNKRTAGMRAVRMERCEQVTLLMRQHIGAQCLPCVKAGERVLAGQLIGGSDAEVSVPVHASISGTVRRIGTVRLPDGGESQAVVIASDGLMEHVEYQPPTVNSQGEFIAELRASGLVGLGGAGFPAYAKLRGAARPGSCAGKADILLVNGAECEPFATADHREMLDSAPDIAEGIRQICRWMGIEKAIVGVEDNKPDAIALLRGHGIAVKKLPSRYPQGTEKKLIHSLTGRVVPLGRLPFDVGVLSMNVSSVAFLGRYMRTGKPLISRMVTVGGDACPTAMNVRVPIGVCLRELLAFCGAGDADPAKIVVGGPMMGVAVPDLDTVINKTDSTVLLLSASQQKPERACIRCGGCLFVCPMRLQPFKLDQAVLAGEREALAKLRAPACVECGCCSYVCPAGRDLAQRIKRGKGMVK